MYFYLGLLLFAVGYGNAAQCTDSVTPIKPVCGSNGEMYYNECDMKDQVYGKVPYPVYPVAWEQCSDTVCNMLCNRYLAPVCASDGEILDNPCVFLWEHVCAKKKYVYEVDMEFCLTKKCPQNCAVNDAKCYREWELCRTGYTSMGK